MASVADVLRSESEYSSPDEINPNSSVTQRILSALGNLSSRYNRWLEGEGEAPLVDALQSPFGRLARRVGRGLPHEEATQPTLGLTTEGLLGAGSVQDQPLSEALRQGWVEELGDVAPFTSVAGQISGAHAPGTNVGVPGYRYGSTAKYRVPMRLQKIRQSPYDEAVEARYTFRNRLDEPKMKGFAEMFLKPEGEANIHYLSLENPESTRSTWGGSHMPGVKPTQMKDAVGRLVEELTNAGYSRITSEPLSNERGRLFARTMRQLKSEGKLPEGVTYEQDLTRYAAGGGHEGRALRRIRERRAREEWDREANAPREEPSYSSDFRDLEELANEGPQLSQARTPYEILDAETAEMLDAQRPRRVRSAATGEMQDVSHIQASDYPAETGRHTGHIFASTADALRNAAPAIGDVVLPSGRTVDQMLAEVTRLMGTSGSIQQPLYDVSMVLDLLGYTAGGRSFRRR